MKHERKNARDWEAEVRNRLGDAGLDEALESRAQSMVARMVRSLPEEAPSMAWRGALDARLAKEGRRSERKARLRWIFAPAGGLALAGALAMALLYRGGGPEGEPGYLEAKIVAAHREAVLGRATAGRGLVVHEARPTDADWEPFGWQEADLEAL